MIFTNDASRMANSANTDQTSPSGAEQSDLGEHHLGRAKRIWYLSPMRAAKVQASLRIRAVSPEPSLLAHTSSESRGTFRQKARSLAPLNGWTCAVKVCHDGMLEDTNSLGAAHLIRPVWVLCMELSHLISCSAPSPFNRELLHLSCIMRKPVYAICEQKDADQPAHLCSLISIFIIRCLDGIMPLVPISEISSLALASFCSCTDWFLPYLVGNP